MGHKAGYATGGGGAPAEARWRHVPCTACRPCTAGRQRACGGALASRMPCRLYLAHAPLACACAVRTLCGTHSLAAQGEADKVRTVKGAEGCAESKYLQASVGAGALWASCFLVLLQLCGQAGVSKAVCLTHVQASLCCSPCAQMLPPRFHCWASLTVCTPRLCAPAFRLCRARAWRASSSPSPPACENRSRCW